MQKLSRFTQEKIENINKAITTKEAKSVIKKKKLIATITNCKTGEFYQTF